MADENANSTPKDPEEPKTGDDSSGSDNQKMVSLAALHEERNKRKELQAKIDEINQREKAQAEKKLAEEGQYQQLLKQKEDELADLKGKYDSATQTLTTFEEQTKKRIEDETSKLNEDDKALVLELLEGKTAIEKQSILPKILAKVTGQSTNANTAPGAGSKGEKTEALEMIAAKKKELEEAKKNKKAMDVLRLQREISDLEEKTK